MFLLLKRREMGHMGSHKAWRLGFLLTFGFHALYNAFRFMCVYVCMYDVVYVYACTIGTLWR